jgi:hypothetical protein
MVTLDILTKNQNPVIGRCPVTGPGRPVDHIGDHPGPGFFGIGHIGTRVIIVVYYKSRKRELKAKLMNESVR